MSGTHVTHNRRGAPGELLALRLLAENHQFLRCHDSYVTVTVSRPLCLFFGSGARTPTTYLKLGVLVL